jgi:MoaF C-terminal domain
MMRQLFLFILIVLLASCQQKPDETTDGIVIMPEDLIGKTIEYRYGESIYHVTIDSDSTMHWEAMAGDEKGTLESETYVIASVDDSKLFITWGEENGIGVSQVLDFKKGLVYNHLLRGRAISAGLGEIEILAAR